MANSLIILFMILSGLISSILRKIKTWSSNNILPLDLLTLEIATKLHISHDSTEKASKDFGNLVHIKPAAVLHPSSVHDIISLVKFSYNSNVPFTIAARGRGHSVRGQAMAKNGVVVDMTTLDKFKVELCPLSGYVDVGGQMLWIDVLQETIRHGVAPVSWTDYLYLTVGGTLSNGGISGQSFRHGPQISNVYEMDVVTGEGELMTCSRNINSELFYAVLGGLGQFGIITRARIAIVSAPKRVKWVRMLYDDFSVFTKDQEHLISIKGPDYVEGCLILDQSPADNWRSSFFSASDHPKITSLVTKHGIIYCLEVVKYYDYDNDDHTINTVGNELQLLLKGLSFLPGLIFTKDVSYMDFLNRVRSGELKLQSLGLWDDVPHPWLNLFIPKSRILDFDSGVFKGIILEQKEKIMGPILVYPTNRKKWDDRMSAMIPNEDTFYSVGFLHSCGINEWEIMDAQNNQVLQFCDEAGIDVKQYLPYYQNKQDWIKHFGSKWKKNQQRKTRFDPKAILSPGQRMFNTN